MNKSRNKRNASIRTWSAMDLKNKWTRKLHPNISRSLPWDVLSQLVKGLSDDTKLPRERLADVIQHRDVSGLFDISTAFDVTEYTSPDLLIQDRLVVDIFSKYDFCDSPFNKRERAKLRFFEAEEMCREANIRIKRTQGAHDNEINLVIHAAKRRIDALLGEFNLDEMSEFSRFGPGASLCVSGAFTTEYFKLCEKNPTVSLDASIYAFTLLKYNPLWGAYLNGMNLSEVEGPFSLLNCNIDGLRLVNHNKVTFVPKNAKTERSIAIEPYFNIFFQLGIGAMIRKRLYAYGINLDSQENNQLKAKIGSQTGHLATIDFSMASDTVCIEGVRLLLPPTWYYHMANLRSKTYIMEGKGKPRPFNKFSTMGNGYTFELETLIFYSIAHASCEALGIDPCDLTVYGDDVILDTRAVDLFIKVCTFLGFKINEEKSFWTGRFRESCGEDFLNGISVRPVFCKELRTTQHVASLANRLAALNRAVGPGSRINDNVDNVVALLHTRIPRDVARQIVGPPSENVDGYIHTTSLQQLAASDLVKWNPRLFAWEHPIVRFVAKSYRRQNDAVTLYANMSLAGRPKAIPSRQEALVNALDSLFFRNPRVYRNVDGHLMHNRMQRDVREYFNERTPLEITGRDIGSYVLGTAVFWDHTLIS